jgi:hypothetical protein
MTQPVLKINVEKVLLLFRNSTLIVRVAGPKTISFLTKTRLDALSKILV